MHHEEGGLVGGPVGAAGVEERAEDLGLAAGQQVELQGAAAAVGHQAGEQRRARCGSRGALPGHCCLAVESGVERGLRHRLGRVVGRQEERERVLAQSADLVCHGVGDEVDLARFRRLDGGALPGRELRLGRLHEHGGLPAQLHEELPRARVVVRSLVVREGAPRRETDDRGDAGAPGVRPLDVRALVAVVVVECVEAQRLGRTCRARVPVISRNRATTAGESSAASWASSVGVPHAVPARADPGGRYVMSSREVGTACGTAAALERSGNTSSSPGHGSSTPASTTATSSSPFGAAPPLALHPRLNTLALPYVAVAHRLRPSRSLRCRLPPSEPRYRRVLLSIV